MKTAVEYLAYVYALQGAIYQDDIDKALEIEIEQIVQTYANGQSDILKSLRKRTIKDRILHTLAGITIGYLIFGL